MERPIAAPIQKKLMIISLAESRSGEARYFGFVERIPALDNARATLLLLGVRFHASVFVYRYQKPVSLGEFLAASVASIP